MVDRLIFLMSHVCSRLSEIHSQIAELGVFAYQNCDCMVHVLFCFMERRYCVLLIYLCAELNCKWVSLIPKLKFEHMHLTSFSSRKVDLAAQLVYVGYTYWCYNIL